MFLRKALHIVALVFRPILRIVGVKGGTTADKAGEVIEVVDKVLPEGTEKESSSKP